MEAMRSRISAAVAVMPISSAVRMAAMWAQIWVSVAAGERSRVAFSTMRRAKSYSADFTGRPPISPSSSGAPRSRPPGLR